MATTQRAAQCRVEEGNSLREAGGKMVDDAPPAADAEQAKSPKAKGDGGKAGRTAGSSDAVEITRARMGLAAVAVSDVVIVAAAIVGVVLVHNGSSSSTSVVSILSSAFTAVGTLTTAYLGIKASANTAKNAMTK
jgi:hypothetical protein